QRNKVIHALQKEFSKLNLSGTLVFDGAHRRGEESGLSYPSPLIVAYSPKGQSADEYIIELIDIAKKPKELTVVTNDRGLILHAKSHGAKIVSNKDFVHWIRGKAKKKLKKEVEPVDTKENIDRLMKIFEERLNDME